MSRHVVLWEALYKDTTPPEQTQKECELVLHFMPVERHRHVLDLACGVGRHAIELAGNGYHITGVDINPRVLEVARAQVQGVKDPPEFLELDLHNLNELEGEYDGVLLFWKSFGFFDAALQLEIFRQVHRLLRKGGRLLLDLYNRRYYQEYGQELLRTRAEFDRKGWEEAERYRFMVGHEESIDVGGSKQGRLLDPNMFTPGEVVGIAGNRGLVLVGSCSQYSPDIPASPEHPRMQLIFERL